MTLSMPPKLRSAIHTHCRAEYPHECCGALIGTLSGDLKTVVRTERLENAEPNSPERRFVIDPAQLLAVERAARQEGLDVIGFYHSHPDAPARPSPTDLEWAWPVYSYLIVSVTGGDIADTRSYVLAEGGAAAGFAEEEIST